MSISAAVRNILSVLGLLMLAGCGGGGGGGGSPPPPPPAAPSALNYVAPPVLTVGAAMTALTPTVTGTVTAYSISSALPAGLTFSTATGTVSGTPTAVQASTNYQVTASNAGGSTTAVFALRVNDVVPSITYPNATYTFTTDVPVAAIAPAATGGAVVTWSIDHTLPAGLTFDTTNGRITGTPTQVAAPAAYVVTAANSGGSDTFDLTIGVRSGVLLELGHTDGPAYIRVSATRVLTAAAAEVVLWNAADGSRLATVKKRCETNDERCVALGGPTFAIRTDAGVELRSSTDGALILSVPMPLWNQSRWALADDGSYLAVGTSAGLTVYSSTGAQLFTRPGNYGLTSMFAAAAELRVAKGPAGDQVIEFIAVPSGAAVTGAPFAAPFHSWFPQGDRFMTVAGNVVGVYATNGAQLGLVTIASVEKIAGQGDWFWTHNAGMLRLYAVGGSATPVASYAAGLSDQIKAGGNGAIALLNVGAKQMSVIDISGATPVKTDYVTPYTYNVGFASRSAGEFWLGASGIVLHKAAGSPFQRYNLGPVRSIAANADRIAVATASGLILLFDADTLAPQGEIDFESSKVELSDDGGTLAASAQAAPPYTADRTLRLYSLPSATIANQWTYTYPANHLFDFSLSGSGTVIGQVFGDLQPGGGGPRTRQVTGFDGTPIWSEATTAVDEPIRLSRDGTKIAVSSEGPRSLTVATSIYVNGVLTSAVSGWAVAWVDDDRLLVNRYARDGSGTISFDGSVIVNSLGQVQSTPTLVELGGLQRLTPTSVYSPGYNQILELPTGEVLWSTVAIPPGGPQLGAATDTHVVFASGATVRAEPR